MKNKITAFILMLCMVMSLCVMSTSAAAPTNYKTVYGGITYNVSNNTGSSLYYRFVPKVTDAYTITATNLSGYACVYLRDFAGKSLKNVYIYSGTQKIQYTLEEGEVYYIEFDGVWEEDPYSYTFNISSWSDTVYGSKEVKSGDTVNFDVVTKGTPPSYVKLVPETDGYYFFEAHSINSYYPVIYIHDKAGTKLTSGNTNISYRLEAGETYYVTSYFSATGNIRLKLYSWQDVDAMAQSLTIGQDYTVNLPNAGDSKWFKLDVPRDNMYSFVSSGSCIPYVKHYKPTGAAGYTYDSHGDGRNFAVRLEYKKGETQYFYVKHYNANATGSFTVKMNEGGAKYQASKEYTTPINGEAWFEDYAYMPGNASVTANVKASGSITVDHINSYDSDSLKKTYTGTNSVSFTFTTDEYVSNVNFRIKAPSANSVTFSYKITPDKTISEGVTYTNTATNEGNPAVYAFTPSKTALYALTSETAYDSMSQSYNPKANVNVVGEYELGNEWPESSGMTTKNYWLLEAGKTYTIYIANMNMTGSPYASAKFYISAVSGDVKTLPFGTSTLSLDANKWTTFAADITKNSDIYVEADKNFGFNVNTYGALDIGTSFSNPVYVGDKLYLVFKNDGSATTAKVTVNYQPETDNSTVYTTNVADLKSKHPYQNNMYKKWVYTAPEGTTYNVLTFSDFALNYDDFLYIYDGNGKQVKKYSRGSTGVCTTPLTLPGRTFTIKLESNTASVAYGFEVGSVENCTLDTPTADKESGTMRPSKVTLTAPSDYKIYYRLVSDWDEGKFVRYTEPVMVSEDCTLETYAKLGDLVSDVAKYKYTIDKTPLQPPTFEIQEKTDTYETFIITAPEDCTIYYSRLDSGSFVKYNGNTLKVSAYKGAYVAYTQLGDMVSEPVYYAYDFGNSTSYTDSEYTLNLPVVEVTPVMGGKQVKISPADGSQLYEKITETNYGGDHMASDCGMDAMMKHTMGPWSREEENNGINLYINDIDTVKRGYNHGNNHYSDEKLTFTVTKNTAINAQHHKTYFKEYGTWQNYYEGGMSHHVMFRPGDIPSYTDRYNYSQTIYEYIEVPQAKTPSISVEDGVATITPNDDFSTIYYSINGGDFEEYSSPIKLSDGMIVKAYASGLGIAQSETVMTGVEVSVKSEFEANPSTGVIPEFELTITNTGDAIDGAQLLVVSTDGDVVTSTITRTVDLRNGITRIYDIAPVVSTSAAEPKVSVYLWESAGNIKPVAVKNTFEIK